MKQKVSRSLAWKHRKKKAGLCQWCGKHPAKTIVRTKCVKKVTIKRRGSICEECDANRRNHVTMKLKVDTDPPSGYNGQP